MKISADRQWTEHELALCRRLSPDYKALSTALKGRSIDSIRAKCRRLGLARTKHIWREQEIDLLRELYPIAPWIRLFEAFPFANKNALQSAAISRGIHRQQRRQPRS